MSQTTTTAWDNVKYQRSTSACFLVHLQSGTTNLYLSTRPLTLTSGVTEVVFQEAIKSISPILHGVDVYSFKYKQNSIRMVLSSGWVRRADDGDQYSYADDISLFLGHSVTIYLFPGGSVADLADCLTVFKGYMTNVFVSVDGIELECDASALVRHRNLPQVIADRATYPNIPPEHDGVVLGMCYGQPSEWTPATPTRPISFQSGAAIPLLVSRGATNRLTGGSTLVYVPDSYHEDYVGVSNLYIYISALDAWSWCSNVGTALSDVNLVSDGYIVLDTDASRWQSLLFPTHALPSSAATVNSMKAVDHIDGSVCNVIASTSSYADVMFEWTNQGTSDDSSIYNTLARFDGFPKLSIIRNRVHGDLDATYIDVWRYSSEWAEISSDFTWTNAIRKDYDIYRAAAPSFNWTAPGSGGVHWHLGSGPTDGDGLPFAIRIRFENASASWTPGVTEVATIEDILIKIGHYWPRNFQPTAAQRDAALRGYPGPFGGTKVLVRPNIKEHSAPSPGKVIAAGEADNADRLLIETSGRAFGSYITTRFASYADVNIYEPGFVIEHILRTELSLDGGSIDTDSVDALLSICQDPDFPTIGPIGYLILPPNSRIYSADLLERYGWEWGIFILQSRDGKVKLFDYEVGLDTVATAVTKDDLINGLPIIETTNVSDIVNKIVVRHTKTEWDDAYFYTESVTDSTSVSGITGGVAVPDDVDCPYLRQDNNGPTDANNTFADGRRHVDRLIDRLIGDAPQAPSATPQRILSRPHAYVILQTIGHKYANAEPGDWITLDATSFDPVMKFFGQSWADINLMVVETEVQEHMTTLKTFNWQPLPLT